MVVKKKTWKEKIYFKALCSLSKLVKTRMIPIYNHRNVET